MAAVWQGVALQHWPHTVDARVWLEQWKVALAANPTTPTDDGAMLGWFANAIMAGYDTATQRATPTPAAIERVARATDALVKAVEECHPQDFPCAPGAYSELHISDPGYWTDIVNAADEARAAIAAMREGGIG